MYVKERACDHEDELTKPVPGIL